MSKWLRHGNDHTMIADQWRNGKLVEPDRFKNYRPAEVGDVFQIDDLKVTISEEDLQRGYIEMGSYRGTHEELCHPVFLVKRTKVLVGNASRASRSEWD